MADNTVVHIGENSPEHVAYRLMLDIAAVEGKTLHRNPGSSSQTAADRLWILNAFVDCMKATKGSRPG